LLTPGVAETQVLTHYPIFAATRSTAARVWGKAVKAVGLPHSLLYASTKHSFATDAIRRGVPERYLQTFLGHRNVESTRRYTRLADNGMLEVLRPPTTPCKHAF